MRLSDYSSPSDHPGAVYLHGLNVWAVRVRGRAAAVAAASARNWTAFRWLGDWFVSDQKPDEKGARELARKILGFDPLLAVAVGRDRRGRLVGLVEDGRLELKTLSGESKG